MYSSSYAGRYTQASWKNGLFVVPAVERRRECVGDGPINSAKVVSYCRMLTCSAERAAILKDVRAIEEDLERKYLMVPLSSAIQSTT